MTEIQGIINRMCATLGVQLESQLAKALGVNAQTFHSWKRRSSIPLGYIIDFVRSTNSSLDWILLGRPGPEQLRPKTTAEVMAPRPRIVGWSGTSALVASVMGRQAELPDKVASKSVEAHLADADPVIASITRIVLREGKFFGAFSMVEETLSLLGGYENDDVAVVAWCVLVAHFRDELLEALDGREVAA